MDAKELEAMEAIARKNIGTTGGLILALVARVRELSNPMCSCCVGIGVPISGLPCICGGTGREGDEIHGLRRLCYSLEAENARLRSIAENPRAVEAAAKMLPGIRRQSGDDVDYLPDKFTAERVLRAAVAAVLGEDEGAEKKAT